MKKLLLFCIILVAVFQYACKKNNTGAPVIKDVRTVNPAQADSFFTQALPGALIVIQGTGFDGLQAVYFNDSLAAVNPVYVTNTNIIVSIPSGTQTAATDPKVPNKIKVVTSHGTATFTFKVVLDPPVITSISFDNTGTMLYINGKNLVGISKITFPIGATGNYDTATGYTINTTWTQIAAGVPPGTAWNDSLRVYCTFGNASFPYPPPMTISAVSDENATAGTTITLTGTNFIGVNQVTFPGGIAGTNLTKVDVNHMTVKVPAGITAPDTLRISGQLGTAAATQLFDSYITYTSPGYLTTFEGDGASNNTGFIGWTGGFANAAAATTAYPGNTGAVGVLDQGSPMGNNAGATSQGNPGLLQLNDGPWVSNTSASITGYSLKFEVFVASPWSKGELWISVGDWYTWTSYTARYAPWQGTQTGTYNPTGWQTVTIPLTGFHSGNQFWQTSYNASGTGPNVFTDFPATSLVFMIANDQATAVPAGSINVAVDNVRIVKGQ
ncbi:MAG TPA: glycan-binding surface protein [Puia sp.]|nr:glycan-binding surface protein [Puia sp.]